MNLKVLLVLLAAAITLSSAARGKSQSSGWSILSGNDKKYYSNSKSSSNSRSYSSSRSRSFSSVSTKLSSLERHPTQVELDDDHPFHAAAPGLRVVGGRNARKEEVPWQAALFIKGTNTVFCGGTIVGTRVIVTAAHCFDQPREFEVGLDGTNRNSLQQRFDSPRAIVHGEYDRATFENDIAVVILNGEIQMSNTVRGASLPKIHTPKGQTGVISGWGTTKFEGSSPIDLKMTTVETLPQMNCRKAYQDFVTITDAMMCAGDINFAKDACQGDSGGPLVLVTGDEYVLIGVVSFGFECAKEGFPGVYTRVNRYINFIESSFHIDDLTTATTTTTTTTMRPRGKWGRSSSMTTNTLHIFIYIALFMLVNNV